jgi:chromosome segregation ATPase
LNARVVPNLDDIWQLIADKAKHTALECARSAFRVAPTVADGVVEAYTVYKACLLEDRISAEETFRVLHSVLQDPIHLQTMEHKYLQTKQQLDVQLDQLQNSGVRHDVVVRDHESQLAAAHRKIAQLVDETLTSKQRLQELDMCPVSMNSGDEVMATFLMLQTKHKELKTELLESRYALQEARGSIQTQDRAVVEQTQRLSTQQAAAHNLRLQLDEQTVLFQESLTNIAIWRTRYEDLATQTTKKRKLTDDLHTDLISVTSEVHFLRNRHEEDLHRIQSYTQENARLSQQIQSLHIQLAMEIAK